MALTNLRVQDRWLAVAWQDEIDEWQLYHDEIDDWQLRGTEAYTVDASVAGFDMCRVYLEIWTTESDPTFPLHRLITNV